MSPLVTAAEATLSRQSFSPSMGSWPPGAGAAGSGAAPVATSARALAWRPACASSGSGNLPARTCGGRNWFLICGGERR